MTEKTCTKCRESKTLEEFSPSKLGLLGRASCCRGCYSLARKAARANRRSLSEYASDPGILRRFWALVDIRGKDECWPWRGSTNNGYGWFGVTTGVQEIASRFALATTGVELGELDALHSCDNRPCCNPGHLRPGTHSENMLDCVASGNLNTQKLSRAQADEIRGLVAAGMKRSDAAGLYGVVTSTVGDICSYRTHNASQELT